MSGAVRKICLDGQVEVTKLVPQNSDRSVTLGGCDRSEPTKMQGVSDADPWCWRAPSTLRAAGG